MASGKSPLLQKLGWAIHGCASLPKKVNYALVHYVCDDTQVHSDNLLYDLVQSSFSFESFGVLPKEAHVNTSEQKRAEEILDLTTVRKGIQFETGLLWSSDELPFCLLPTTMHTRSLNSLPFTMPKSRNTVTKGMLSGCPRLKRRLRLPEPGTYHILPSST